MKSRIRVKCDCGCGWLEFGKWDEEAPEFEISYYVRAYDMVGRPWDHFVDTLKMVWTIIRGREYLVYDLVVSQKEFSKFIKKVAIYEGVE